MAYTSHNTRIFGGFSVWQRLIELPAHLAERTAKYRLYRETLGELSRLSDRELADVGISRGMIRDVALEAAHSN